MKTTLRLKPSSGKLLVPPETNGSACLAFPEESLKLIFTLAQRGDEYAGVMALSVET